MYDVITLQLVKSSQNYKLIERSFTWKSRWQPRIYNAAIRGKVSLIYNVFYHNIQELFTLLFPKIDKYFYWFSFYWCVSRIRCM